MAVYSGRNAKISIAGGDGEPYRDVTPAIYDPAPRTWLPPAPGVRVLPWDEALAAAIDYDGSDWLDLVDVMDPRSWDWPLTEVPGDGPLSPTEAMMLRRGREVLLGEIGTFDGDVLDAHDAIHFGQPPFDGERDAPEDVATSTGIIVNGYPYEVAWPDGPVIRRRPVDECGVDGG